MHLLSKFFLSLSFSLSLCKSLFRKIVFSAFSHVGRSLQYQRLWNRLIICCYSLHSSISLLSSLSLSPLCLSKATISRSKTSKLSMHIISLPYRILSSLRVSLYVLAIRSFTLPINERDKLFFAWYRGSRMNQLDQLISITCVHTRKNATHTHQFTAKNICRDSSSEK